MMREQLLEGFVFAGPEDEANALALVEAMWTAVNEGEPATRSPVFFLCGPPASGKTVMLQRFLRPFARAAVDMFSVPFKLDRIVLKHLAKSGRPVKVLGLVGSRSSVEDSLKGEVLKEWLAAKLWLVDMVEKLDPDSKRMTRVQVSREITGVLVLVSFWPQLAEHVPEGMKVIRLLERPREEKEEKLAA